MSISYQELTKKLDKLVEEGSVDFFIVFKFDLNKNKLQELYTKDPRDFFGKRDDREAKNFARQIVKVKKMVQQMLSNPDFNKGIATFSTTIMHNVNVHVIVVQTQIFFIATSADFFSLMSKISGEIKEIPRKVHELNQQNNIDLTQLLNIEKMILQRIEKLENLATMMIEVTKQLKDVLEKK